MKRQIVEFNMLLEQQVRMMQIQETGVTPLPTSNGSLVQQSESAIQLSCFVCLTSFFFFFFVFPFLVEASSGLDQEISCVCNLL